MHHVTLLFFPFCLVFLYSACLIRDLFAASFIL